MYGKLTINEFTPGEIEARNRRIAKQRDIRAELEAAVAGMTPAPGESAGRKAIPLASGCLDYFPLALQEVAKLSFEGNRKHNPGEPLHWSREKSDDHADCILRHMVDRGTVDTDGFLHDVKVAWRALAQLQIALESSMGEPLYVDMQDAIEIGPLVDGSYCFVAPDSEPLVTKGPLIPNKVDVWYVAVFGLGSRGHFHMVQGWYPVRQFHERDDAVALHDMILRKEVRWPDAIEVVISDGKRGLVGTPKLIVGDKVPTVADLHRGRNLRR